MFFVEGGKNDAVCKISSHDCQVEGDSHFSSSPGYVSIHTAHDAVSLHCCWGTWQFAVYQVHKVLFNRTASHTVSPQLVLLHGLLSCQGRILHLSWQNFIWFSSAHSSSLSRSHWKTAWPLSIVTGPSSLVLWECTLLPPVIHTGVKQDRSKYRSFGTLLGTRYWPPGTGTIHPYFFSNMVSFIN